MWCPVTQPVKKKKQPLLGILVNRDKRTRPGGLRKGGWAEGCGPIQTSREPKPPDFPRPPSGPCSPEGPGGSQGRGGARPWGPAGSGFILLAPLQQPQECPELGAGKPASEVALTLQ